MWETNLIQSLIKDRSNTIGQYLFPRQPETPSNNSLIEDRISKAQVLLRDKLDEIQGNDPDNELTGQIVDAITIGSKVQPISKDHNYSDREIDDFMRHQEKLEEWKIEKKLVEQRNQEITMEIPSMCVVYSNDKDDFILVMSSGTAYVRELGIDLIDNVIGRRYVTYLNYFKRASDADIENYLSNIDWDQLRLRLVNAGYSEYVDNITNLLENY